MRYSTPEKCLNPQCDQQSKSRGLCPACYTQALYLVKSGKTTWAILESLGKTKPKQFNSKEPYHGFLTRWLLNEDYRDPNKL